MDTLYSMALCWSVLAAFRALSDNRQNRFHCMDRPEAKKTHEDTCGHIPLASHTSSMTMRLESIGLAAGLSMETLMSYLIPAKATANTEPQGEPPRAQRTTARINHGWAGMSVRGRLRGNVIRTSCRENAVNQARPATRRRGSPNVII